MVLLPHQNKGPPPFWACSRGAGPPGPSTFLSFCPLPSCSTFGLVKGVPARLPRTVDILLMYFWLLCRPFLLLVTSILHLVNSGHLSQIAFVDTSLHPTPFTHYLFIACFPPLECEFQGSPPLDDDWCLNVQ